MTINTRQSLLWRVLLFRRFYNYISTYQLNYSNIFIQFPVAEKLNINYVSEGDPEFNKARHALDIFYPDSSDSTSCPIMVFIHGGTWMYGSKDPYATLGHNLLPFGIVVVTINYRLGTSVNFRKMASDCARAVKWVKENAADFGGDPSRITISGHSAGGHLGALITLDKSYFEILGTENPVTKVLLIDAFGLNIGTMIKKHGQMFLGHVETIFTNDPEVWKTASPLQYITNRKLPFLILTGSRSYPILLYDNKYFAEKLKKVNDDVTFIEVPGKSHLEMITQFQKKNTDILKKVADFVLQQH